MLTPTETFQLCEGDLDRSLIEVLDSPQDHASETTVPQAIHDLVVLRLSHLEAATNIYSTKHHHQEIKFLLREKYIWTLIDHTSQLRTSRSALYQTAQLRAYMEGLIKQYSFLNEDDMMAEVEEEVLELARRNHVLSENKPKRKRRRTPSVNQYEVMCQNVFRCLKGGDTDRAISISRAEDKPWRTLLLLQHIEEKAKTLEGKHADWLVQQRAALSDLYKRTLLEGDIGKHEAALLGVLSGETSRVLPACSSWEDIVWAYYNGCVHDAIDGEVYNRQQNQQDFLMDAKHIELAKSKTKSLKDGFSLSFAMLTLGLLQGSIQEGIAYCCSLVLDKTKSEELRISEDSWLYPYMLRFLSSLILFCRIHLALPSIPETDEILGLYAQMSVKKPNFRPKVLALCAANLPKKMQISIVSEFLAGNYWDSDERELLFDMGEQYDLSMILIIRRTWDITLRNYFDKESAIHKEPRGIRLDDDDDEDITNEMTCGTRRCLKQFGWLLMNEHLYFDAIKAANVLINHFLQNEQLHTAKLLFEQIPESVVNMAVIQSSGDAPDLPSDIREFQRLESLLQEKLLLKK